MPLQISTQIKYFHFSFLNRNENRWIFLSLSNKQGKLLLVQRKG